MMHWIIGIGIKRAVKKLLIEEPHVDITAAYNESRLLFNQNVTLPSNDDSDIASDLIESLQNINIEDAVSFISDFF